MKILVMGYYVCLSEMLICIANFDIWAGVMTIFIASCSPSWQREELELAKNQGHLEKQRMKARLKTKLEAEKERLKKDMIMQLREQKVRCFYSAVVLYRC